MSKTTTTFLTKAAQLRTPIAVGAAGLCAAAGLGTGVAFASDGNGGQTNALQPRDSAAQQVDSTQQRAGVQQDTAQQGAKKQAQADEREERADRGEKRAKDWTTPVDKPYKLTADFGNSGDRWSQKHSGQDFAVPTGTEVRSAGKGTVVTTGWGGSYGNRIVIEHENGQYTQYAHLSKIDVRPGQQVDTEQTIGKSGSTGNSSGPHLHFEVRTTSNYGSGIDPVKAMAEHGVKF